MKAATAAILAFLTAGGLAAQAWDQASAQARPWGRGEGPISITADRLETDDATGVVQFIGAVVARQGSLTLTCDLMKVFYTPPPPGAAGEAASSPLAGGDREIDRVEGFGQVKMVDGDRLALGNQALYLARSLPRRLILIGDARVWQGRDSLTGNQITYFLDERRSVVDSAPRQRVKTVIHGGEESK